MCIRDSKEDDVFAVFKSAVDTFGRVDILVNNAGITNGYPIADMTLAQWRGVLDTNLTGTFLMCREMVRHCRQSQPVSYTHLDVYKRQAIRCQRCQLCDAGDWRADRELPAGSYGH